MKSRATHIVGFSLKAYDRIDRLIAALEKFQPPHRTMVPMRSLANYHASQWITANDIVMRNDAREKLEQAVWRAMEAALDVQAGTPTNRYWE